MIVMQKMDELMHLSLAGDEIAAAHVCACNPRKLKHYPADWSVALSKNPLNPLISGKGARELRLHTAVPSCWSNSPDADHER